MKLLILNHIAAAAVELERALLQRNPSLQVTRAESPPAALEVLNRSYSAVIMVEHGGSLERARFIGLVERLRVRPIVLGVDTTSSSDIRHVADQVLALVGAQRSALVDTKIIEPLGFAGSAELNWAKWANIDAPVLLVTAVRDSFDLGSVGAAQRASLVRGPGLAETLEVFWDDPQPHLVQVVPAGVSLQKVLPRRSAVPVGVPTALAIVRGVSEGLATLHELGFGAGGLEQETLWLTLTGQVLVLGHGIIQLRNTILPWNRRWLAPEEAIAEVAPELPGDPFRLGLLLMALAVGEDPYGHMSAAEFLRRGWSLASSGHQHELRPIAELLEMLLQVDSVDRPRGALLREVINRAAPPDWQALVAGAAKLHLVQ